MPVRRSVVHSLEVVARDADSVTLELHVSSGTYVRSIAQALGGHCTTLRRTAVGPFGVDEADPERLLPAADALARLPADAVDARAGGDPHARARARGRPAVKVAREPGELERTPRAVAIGTFDGVHLGHQSVVRTAIEAGPLPTVVTFHPHPREVLGNRVALLSTLERRLELLAELGVEETLVVEFTPELAALAPEEFADVVPRRDRRGDRRLRRGLPLRSRAQRRPRAAGRARHGDPRGAARRGRLLDGDPAARRRRRRARRCRDARPAGRGGGNGRLGRGTRRHARLPDGEPAHGSHPARPALRHLCGRRARPPRGRVDRRQPALRRRRAEDRGVPARLRGRPLRPAARLRGVGATARGGRIRLRGGARRPDRADVEATRAATRP